MAAIVYAANIHDRDGGVRPIASLFGLYPFLAKLFADAGYSGKTFRKDLQESCPHLSIKIVKKPKDGRGFAVLPKCWIVERTTAWPNRCRRLAKDWENLSSRALSFLHLASIRLMLRKLRKR